MRIGIVAAEPSGDLLAAGLMAELKVRRPDVAVEGIGGERMLAVGMDSWAPMEQLSVMGLVEVLKHLPSLLRLRRDLLQRWLASPPDLFIGVDAPDFNLTLERKLKVAGVPTVHYVSPTVWAWRSGRVKHVRQAVDLLLGIFPFEVEFLRKHQVPVRYVGHPLAAEMPLEPDRTEARARLGLAEDDLVLALLPGSRRSELERLAEPFLRAAEWLRGHKPQLKVVTPLVNDGSRRLFEASHSRIAPQLPIQARVGESRAMLAAADLVLTASGTATFEALLSKRPMVVGYQVNAVSYWLVRLLGLIEVDHIAMANLLADERLAPEFIQRDCNPENLGQALLAWLDEPARMQAVRERYRQIHQALRKDTNREAAEAVLELLP